MNLFLYWLGRYRLLFWVCPNCDSSPPRRGCVVCHGTYQYGRPGSINPATPEALVLWRERWDALR